MDQDEADKRWTAHLMERENLKAELTQARIDAAKVVHALDCAVQTVDALIAWMPEGLTLSPEVSGCKQRLDMAMRAVMGGGRK